MVDIVDVKRRDVAGKLAVICALKKQVLAVSSDLKVAGLEEQFDALQNNVKYLGVRLPAYDGLECVGIDGDGDCFFNALRLHLPAYPDPFSLRGAVADFLAANRHHADFTNFWASMDDGGFNEHIADIRKKKWGGEHEIKAIHHMTRRLVVVIQQRGKPLLYPEAGITDEEFDTSQAPIFLLYDGKRHYDGLTLKAGVDGWVLARQLKQQADSATQAAQLVGYEGDPTAYLKGWLRAFRRDKGDLEDDGSKAYPFYELVYQLTRVSLHAFYDNGLASLETIKKSANDITEQLRNDSQVDDKSLGDINFQQAIDKVMVMPDDILYPCLHNQHAALYKHLETIKKGYGISDATHAELMKLVDGLLEPVEADNPGKYLARRVLYFELDGKLLEQMARQSSPEGGGVTASKASESLSTLQKTLSNHLCHSGLNLLTRLNGLTDDEFRGYCFERDALSSRNLIEQYRNLKEVFHLGNIPSQWKPLLEEETKRYLERLDSAFKDAKDDLDRLAEGVKDELTFHCVNAAQQEAQAFAWQAAAESDDCSKFSKDSDRQIALKQTHYQRRRRCGEHALKAYRALWSAHHLYETMAATAPEGNHPDRQCWQARIVMRRRISQMLLLVGSTLEAQFWIFSAKNLLNRNRPIWQAELNNFAR